MEYDISNFYELFNKLVEYPKANLLANQYPDVYIQFNEGTLRIWRRTFWVDFHPKDKEPCTVNELPAYNRILLVPYMIDLLKLCKEQDQIVIDLLPSTITQIEGFLNADAIHSS